MRGCGGWGEFGLQAQETAQTGGFCVGLYETKTAARLFAAGGMFRRLQGVFNGVARRFQRRCGAVEKGVSAAGLVGVGMWRFLGCA